MDKLEMKTARISQENIEKIRGLFPNAVTEVIKDGKVELAVDFDVLKQELSDSLIEAGQERYQMTWPDKKKSVLLANSAISATLRPCREESVDFDTTQNLYIEGDNLDVLKLLRETYLGKVKMIYIDPPYNTGHDSFVYNDCYSMDEEKFLKAGGYYDEDGNRVIDVKENNESTGKFHTEWLNMIYPRLKIARDLLTDDGVIFISIDDNEQANLKKICDEIFGESNFLGQFVWRRSISANDADKKISNDHEYILLYGKTSFSKFIGLPKDDSEYHNPDNDPRGKWKKSVMVCSKTKEQRPNLYYSIKDPKTGVTYECNPRLVWAYEKSTMEKLINEGRIIFPHKEDGKPALKLFWNELLSHYNPISTFIDSQNNFSFELNQKGTKEISALFGEKVFSYPKYSGNIKNLIKILMDKNDIILDFFSGSATTAHAVMQQNAEDGGNRKFIMVQLPEKCDEKSEAYKAGYKNICEIGKERIRRAGKKIKEETGKTDLDTGFRVLKLDSSNMQNVFYNPAAMTQDLLSTTIDNVKPDRTPMDLLFQIMLELGVQLSAKIEEKEICGKKYYVVNENEIIAYFDDNLNNDVITEIAKQQPLYAVFKDKSFATDSVGINNEQLFKTYSPTTEVKVI